jgi:hypothetical protein
MHQRPLPQVEDDRLEPLRPDAPVFEVAAVRSRHRVSRGVLAAVAVGIVAFVAGLAIASPGPGSPVLAQVPVASSAASPVPASAAGPGATPAVVGVAPGGAAAAGTPVPNAAAGSGPGPDGRPRPTLPPPGSSAFVAAFDPVAVIASVPGGERCTGGEPRVKEVPRTRMDGPRITFQRSWLAWCPLPGERRQAFLLHLLERLTDVVPADTFGYSAGGTGDGDALFPYAERPLAGTVSLTAGEAGDGYAIAVIVEEWRVDQER